MKKYTERLSLKCTENLKTLIFHIYFLNMDISLIMIPICLKTAIHVSKTHMEGSMSQNNDIGLRFCFTAYGRGDFRKIYKKSGKLPFFCCKRKTRT